MTNSRQSLVQQLCTRIRELLGESKQQNRSRTFQLREYALSPEDMPWYPHALQLTPEELQLLHWLRRELNNELEPADSIGDAEVVYLALQELQLALRSVEREDEILRLGFYLARKGERVSEC